MTNYRLHAVTGAFGYSGKHIARILIERGRQVITLTNSLHKPNPFGQRIRVHPLCFDDPKRLTEALRGVETLYNTYWVRFNYRGFSHEQAVHNSRILFRAAREAGVERIVHISITNPSLDSPLSYFRGKAQVEEALKSCGASYAILRPAVLFGHEDILINNIAWALRHLPIFGVFGDGQYRLQPIFVQDLAQLAVAQGETRDNATIHAIGPETYTYRGLVETIAEIIGARRPIVSVPPWLGYAAGRVIGKMVGDVFITRGEIEGLMADLLYVEGAEPVGRVRLSDWARTHRHELGRDYASELARRADAKMKQTDRGRTRSDTDENDRRPRTGDRGRTLSSSRSGLPSPVYFQSKQHRPAASKRGSRRRKPANNPTRANPAARAKSRE
ncbi:MAG: NAD(P)H-binding protein [Chloroflexi bacterium]|nr:NAD(P)H-binding protein [Chloroflexota bacterium]